MKATGRTIVFGTREPLRYCSTFAFDSKWGMPVFRSAEATLDRTTCLIDAAFAASTAVVPCRTSFSGWTEKSGSNGVVTTKKPSTFRTSGACLTAGRTAIGWGFEPQITRLGGGCPFRARLPERCVEVMSHH